MPPTTSASTARSPSRWCTAPAVTPSLASDSGARRAPPRACRTPTSASCTRSARRTGSSSSRWNCSTASPWRHGWRAGPFRSPRAPTSRGPSSRRSSAIHARGIVHRDLKPSNIFLTPHGVKLLDFGLARAAQDANDQTHAGITMAGTVVGTPHYMSPEQLTGDPLDARSDLFAVGAILFELLVGATAFPGKTTAQVFHGVMYEPLPSVGGSPALAAVDRVIHRATAKRPADRYPDAAAMAEDLGAALRLADSGETPAARRMTRLIVLPFRMLRPDPEIDFLSFSLADAITASLGTLESLVVRSSLAAARFKTDGPDLSALASELDVDAAITGTLLRAGTQVRVATQLVEAQGGRLLWSAHGAGAAARCLSAPGRPHPPHRRVARAAALHSRTAVAVARRAGNRPIVRVLPARERAGVGSQELVDCPRSLRAGAAGRSMLCASLGAARAGAPADWKAGRRQQ